jgi:hypothetical protein
MESLPSIIDYSQDHGYLPPDSVSYNSSAVPLTGSTFTDGGKQIEIMLPKQNAFLIPDSLYIKYQLTVNTLTINAVQTNTAYMIGGYNAPFLRLDTYVGGKIIDSIQQKNLVDYAILNLTHNPSEKVGLQGGYYGTFKGATDNTVANDINHLPVTPSATPYNFAGPLNCMLAHCKKALPLFAMGQIKLTFYTDSFLNFLNYTTSVAFPITAASYTISNFEVCYELFNPGASYVSHILNQPRIKIKTKSFLYISQPITSGTGAGTTTLNFNVNINSIKSAFLLMSAGARNAYTTNGLYDFIDASSGGDYQLLIAQQPIPQKPLSVSQNMAGVLAELRKATSSLLPFNTIFDKSNNMSITNTEFSYLISQSTTTPTTYTVPSKFVLGIHTEKLYSPMSDHIIFSGVSSQNSAIIARINVANTLNATSCPSGVQAGLLIVYDALLEIDNEFQQVNVQM